MIQIYQRMSRKLHKKICQNFGILKKFIVDAEIRSFVIITLSNFVATSRSYYLPYLLAVKLEKQLQKQYINKDSISLYF